MLLASSYSAERKNMATNPENVNRRTLLGILAIRQELPKVSGDYETKQRGEGDLLLVPDNISTRTRGESCMEEPLI
jgi:hypothetical protein